MTVAVDQDERDRYQDAVRCVMLSYIRRTVDTTQDQIGFTNCLNCGAVVLFEIKGEKIDAHCERRCF